MTVSVLSPVWWRTSKTRARLEFEKQDHTLVAQFYSIRRRSWQCAPPKTTTGRFHSKRGLDATVSEVEPVRDEGESGNRSCRWAMSAALMKKGCETRGRRVERHTRSFAWSPSVIFFWFGADLFFFQASDRGSLALVCFSWWSSTRGERGKYCA